MMDEKRIRFGMIGKKIVAAYLLCGGLVCFALVFSQLTVFATLHLFLPVVISTVILSIPVAAGAMQLFCKPTTASDNLMFISLIIQVFQFSIMGFTFINYFGPYLAVSITDTPTLNATLEYHTLSYRVMNGYRQNAVTSTFFINLIPVAILVLLYYTKGAANRRNI